MRLLALLGCFVATASCLSFGFLLGDVTLRLSLVLLRLALFLEVFVADHAADGFFGETLGAFDYALDASSGPLLLSSDMKSSLLA